MVSWEKSSGVAIGILHPGYVHTAWAIMLRRLVIPGDARYILVTGVPYDIGRNKIVDKFLEGSEEYLFFLDTDVILDNDALVYLIKISREKNLPVVSALYWRRYPPIHPAMWVYKDESKREYIPVYPFECRTCKQPIMNVFTASEHRRMGHEVVSKWNLGDILLVDAVHMGATLVKRWVFERLRELNPDKPFFYYTFGKHGEDIQVSEDFYFSRRLVEELHIKPAVATNILAKHIAHTYVNPLTGEIEFLEG
jgi:hypothetical protein